MNKEFPYTVEINTYYYTAEQSLYKWINDNFGPYHGDGGYEYGCEYNFKTYLENLIDDDSGKVAQILKKHYRFHFRSDYNTKNTISDEVDSLLLLRNIFIKNEQTLFWQTIPDEVLALFKYTPAWHHTHVGIWTFGPYGLKTGHDAGIHRFCFKNKADAVYFKLEHG